MSKYEDGINETEICKNLENNMTLMKLDIDRLWAENADLREGIKYYYKYESLKILQDMLYL